MSKTVTIPVEVLGSWINALAIRDPLVADMSRKLQDAMAEPEPIAAHPSEEVKP